MNTPIPTTQREILDWLQPLLSKQYDAEETAVHAVEEYRDAIVGAMLTEADRIAAGGEWVQRAGALRNFASRLLGQEQVGRDGRNGRDADFDALEAAVRAYRVAVKRNARDAGASVKRAEALVVAAAQMVFPD